VRQYEGSRGTPRSDQCATEQLQQQGVILEKTKSPDKMKGKEEASQKESLLVKPSSKNAWAGSLCAKRRASMVRPSTMDP
jgi:hypothetical protein